ncbi:MULTISPECIES: hypothetical protein [unclassified Paenibacillus]|uniref:hypothetical protein n=1 Tax=unclassified Paenibacillus TaxID=185978 RepID=UPI002405D2BF|nr:MULTISPECIES: hypothetical protein [unclassified Paenibacillus]MDF9840982.1 energy-converting hydrogenase Eha subunit E [Paenibacillus sp. PastF-2]MDF9847846.1 energy-converting hydrogenase Eha subunit E [Paenibacillus sp. PastM-2]MDF9854414.1 energy-converting hydrogenase Eha subunit E [Paenibacillus sp. PastF-1]MDH6479415.1 energy-converting hydrogenase Eha subunit E [Paenibacillus sp. PastH-2]
MNETNKGRKETFLSNLNCKRFIYTGDKEVLSGTLNAAYGLCARKGMVRKPLRPNLETEGFTFE